MFLWKVAEPVWATGCVRWEDTQPDLVRTVSLLNLLCNLSTWLVPQESLTTFSHWRSFRLNLRLLTGYKIYPGLEFCWTYVADTEKQFTNFSVCSLKSYWHNIIIILRIQEVPKRYIHILHYYISTHSKDGVNQMNASVTVRQWLRWSSG
jgi:hypothetical protein